MAPATSRARATSGRPQRLTTGAREAGPGSGLRAAAPAARSASQQPPPGARPLSLAPPSPRSFLEPPGRHKGKTVIVTGANAGLGFAAASALAAAGASVLMVCRSAERGADAVARVRAATGSGDVSLEVCDVSSLESIKGGPPRGGAARAGLQGA
jgi:hypothetical protein